MNKTNGSRPQSETVATRTSPAELTSEPLVSVVMVVCNVERFLAESIESILHQTFADFEFVIVDFGSTDRSKTIVSDYAAKDQRIGLHEIPHCGLGEARNVACSLARGRYIAIMDADDVSLPDRLMLQVEFMNRHPEVALLGGATEWVDAAGQFLCMTDFPSGDSELRAELTTHCAFCQPTVLLRREAFILAGGYRDAFAPAEDYDLWLRIVEHFQCANLKEVVLRYRIHPNQVSMRKRVKQTLGILSAKASASIRGTGKADPFNGVQEISSEMLAGLGITAAVQENSLVSESRQWLRQMCMAGEFSTALYGAIELSQSTWKYVERWQISELHLMIAGLYWKKKQFPQSFLHACHAAMMRPVVLVRPFRLWLRLLRPRFRNATPWSHGTPEKAESIAKR